MYRLALLVYYIILHVLYTKIVKSTKKGKVVGSALLDQNKFISCLMKIPSRTWKLWPHLYPAPGVQIYTATVYGDSI